MATTPNRALWGTILVLTLFWIGLAAGTAVGARFVPKGSGLAGPAIALGYGVAAAFGAGLLGALSAWRMPPAALRRSGYASIAISLAVLALVGWRITTQRAEQRALAGLDQPLPEPVELRVHAEWSEREQNRSFREMDIDGSNWGFRFVAVGPEAAECRGVLNADEAEALIGATAANLEEACPDAGGEAILTVEVKRAGVRKRVAADAACLQRSSEMQFLQRTLFRLPIDGVSHGRLSCD